VTVNNRSNNATTAALAWTGASAGGGWLMSDQYISVNSTINTSNGGLQIYTNNTAATGVTKYTGLISSNTATPAGLVNESNGATALPTAWSASTSTVNGITALEPNNCTVNATGCNWFYHEDKAQVANNQNASNFGNGDPFITFYASQGTPLFSQATQTTTTTTASNSGIHFAQGPTQFGGFSSNATTFFYTEANFTNALVGTTYGTTELVLEAFSL